MYTVLQLMYTYSHSYSYTIGASSENKKNRISYQYFLFILIKHILLHSLLEKQKDNAGTKTTHLPQNNSRDIFKRISFD